MALLLLLAALGGIIRALAPEPSTLRDLGTLMLVLWLPVVGNLIAYVIKKLPKSAPPPTHFLPDAAFVGQLEVDLEPVVSAAAGARSLSSNQLVTLLVGRRGFTVRLGSPFNNWAAHERSTGLMLELLHPRSAQGHLRPGTEFHLLVGKQPIAKGIVIRCALNVVQ